MKDWKGVLDFTLFVKKKAESEDLGNNINLVHLLKDPDFEGLVETWTYKLKEYAFLNILHVELSSEEQDKLNKFIHNADFSKDIFEIINFLREELDEELYKKVVIAFSRTYAGGLVSILQRAEFNQKNESSLSDETRKEIKRIIEYIEAETDKIFDKNTSTYDIEDFLKKIDQDIKNILDNEHRLIRHRGINKKKLISLTDSFSKKFKVFGEEKALRLTEEAKALLASVEDILKNAKAELQREELTDDEAYDFMFKIISSIALKLSDQNLEKIVNNLTIDDGEEGEQAKQQTRNRQILIINMLQKFRNDLRIDFYGGKKNVRMIEAIQASLKETKDSYGNLFKNPSFILRTVLQSMGFSKEAKKSFVEILKNKELVLSFFAQERFNEFWAQQQRKDWKDIGNLNNFTGARNAYFESLLDEVKQKPSSEYNLWSMYRTLLTLFFGVTMTSLTLITSIFNLPFAKSKLLGPFINMAQGSGSSLWQMMLGITVAILIVNMLPKVKTLYRTYTEVEKESKISALFRLLYMTPIEFLKDLRNYVSPGIDPRSDSIWRSKLWFVTSFVGFIAMNIVLVCTVGPFFINLLTLKAIIPSGSFFTTALLVTIFISPIISLFIKGSGIRTEADASKDRMLARFKKWFYIGSPLGLLLFSGVLYSAPYAILILSSAFIINNILFMSYTVMELIEAFIGLIRPRNTGEHPKRPFYHRLPVLTNIFFNMPEKRSFSFKEIFGNYKKFIADKLGDYGEAAYLVIEEKEEILLPHKEKSLFNWAIAVNTDGFIKTIAVLWLAGFLGENFDEELDKMARSAFENKKDDELKQLKSIIRRQLGEVDGRGELNIDKITEASIAELLENPRYQTLIDMVKNKIKPQVIYLFTEGKLHEYIHPEKGDGEYRDVVREILRQWTNEHLQTVVGMTTGLRNVWDAYVKFVEQEFMISQSEHPELVNELVRDKLQNLQGDALKGWNDYMSQTSDNVLFDAYPNRSLDMLFDGVINIYESNVTAGSRAKAGNWGWHGFDEEGGVILVYDSDTYIPISSAMKMPYLVSMFSNPLVDLVQPPHIMRTVDTTIMYAASEAHNAWDRVRLFNEIFTGHYGHSIAMSGYAFKNDFLPLLLISPDIRESKLFSRLYSNNKKKIADFVDALVYGEYAIDFASEDIMAAVAMYAYRLIRGAMISGYIVFMKLFESFERNLKQVQMAWTRWSNIERWGSDQLDDFTVNPIMPLHGKHERMAKEQFYGRHIPAMVNFVLLPFLIYLYGTAYQAIFWFALFASFSVIFNQSICTHLYVDKIKTVTDELLKKYKYSHPAKRVWAYFYGAWEGQRMYFGRKFFSFSAWGENIRLGMHQRKDKPFLGAVTGFWVGLVEFILPLDLIRRTLLFAGFQIPINVVGYVLSKLYNSFFLPNIKGPAFESFKYFRVKEGESSWKFWKWNFYEVYGNKDKLWFSRSLAFVIGSACLLGCLTYALSTVGHSMFSTLIVAGFFISAIFSIMVAPYIINEPAGFTKYTIQERALTYLMWPLGFAVVFLIPFFSSYLVGNAFMLHLGSFILSMLGVIWTHYVFEDEVREYPAMERTLTYMKRHFVLSSILSLIFTTSLYHTYLLHGLFGDKKFFWLYMVIGAIITLISWTGIEFKKKSTIEARRIVNKKISNKELEVKITQAARDGVDLEESFDDGWVLRGLIRKEQDKAIVLKALVNNGSLDELIPELKELKNIIPAGEASKYKDMSAWRHTEKMLEILQAIADNNLEIFNHGTLTPISKENFEKLASEYNEIAKNKRKLFILWISVLLQDVGKIENMKLYALYSGKMAKDILSRFKIDLTEDDIEHISRIISKQAYFSNIMRGESSLTSLKDIDLNILRLLDIVNIRSIGEEGDLNDKKINFMYSLAAEADTLNNLERIWYMGRFKLLVADANGELDGNARRKHKEVIDLVDMLTTSIGNGKGMAERIRFQYFLRDFDISAYPVLNKLDVDTLLKFLYLLYQVSNNIKGVKIGKQPINIYQFNLNDLSEESAKKLQVALVDTDYLDIKEVVDNIKNIKNKLKKGETVIVAGVPIFINIDLATLIIDTKNMTGLQSFEAQDASEKAVTFEVEKPFYWVNGETKGKVVTGTILGIKEEQNLIVTDKRGSIPMSLVYVNKDDADRAALEILEAKATAVPEAKQSVKYPGVQSFEAQDASEKAVTFEVEKPFYLVTEEGKVITGTILGIKEEQNLIVTDKRGTPTLPMGFVYVNREDADMDALELLRAKTALDHAVPSVDKKELPESKLELINMSI